ncbi:uncharacterized protein [Diabrotica undecimpunctata]|uniref:uncharacterized protein n=1 Tax=Diabrotica undecimpunctata TaxID=50387 RepID=UPI003B632828
MSFDTERFIVEIENRPCLWNSASNDYSDRNLKIKCWEELVNIFQDKEEMSNQEKKQLCVALQKKWKSIRGCYTREVSRQKNLKSGSGGGSRKSQYVFFQQLQFLKPVVAIKEPEHVAGDESVENIEIDREVVRCPKRKKTKDTTTEPEKDKFLETLNRSIEMREKHEANSEDEDRLFLLSLLGTLKKVPQEKKMVTRIQMMTLFDNATRNIESPGSYGHQGTYRHPYQQSSWSQSQQVHNSTHHFGYSSRPGGSEMPHSSYQSPASVSNFSEESSILDIYDL